MYHSTSCHRYAALCLPSLYTWPQNACIRPHPSGILSSWRLDLVLRSQNTFTKTKILVTMKPHVVHAPMIMSFVVVWVCWTPGYGGWFYLGGCDTVSISPFSGWKDYTQTVRKTLKILHSHYAISRSHLCSVSLPSSPCTESWIFPRPLRPGRLIGLQQLQN